ncbi:MAG TPA: RluA family pseudouridine synthase [Vicinamibacteria bacterium]|nr:RluA family pseudouridine synthase [Vicinamibacteria bacterium]
MTRPSSARRLSRVVTAGEAGQRLDGLVGPLVGAALGAPVSRAAVRRLVMAGAVRVDGRPLRRPGAALAAGSRLEVLVDPTRLGPPPAEREAARRFGPERFVYRDAFLLAVDKPAGLAMHATADASRPNLYDLVKALLRSEGGEPYLGLHHRLDLETSGVVLFTLDPAANAALARAFETGEGVAKTYHALCTRPAHRVPARWRVTGPLGDDGPHADTAFRVLRALPAALLVEARPSTGRKHQIRIQLAQRGLPILGDRRYGRPGGRDAPRVMLHAHRLALTHPLTGAALTITSPYPPDFERLVTRTPRRARS